MDYFTIMYVEFDTHLQMDTCSTTIAECYNRKDAVRSPARKPRARA